MAANFEIFWSVYPRLGPRKSGRDLARAAFSAAVRAGAHPQDIIAGARAYAADPATTTYALAATWLHQRRWEAARHPRK